MENGKLSLKESSEVFFFLFLMNDEYWERLLLADGEIQWGVKVTIIPIKDNNIYLPFFYFSTFHK